MRASLTSATLTAPRARDGATRRSHAARPGTATGRPWWSTTDTDKDLPAVARAILRRAKVGSGMLGVRRGVGLVGLDDLLHQLVADDVAVVELDELDPFDAAADFHRLDQPGHPSGRQVDLRDVAGDH